MPPLGSRLLKRFAKRIPKAVAGSFASLRSKPVSTRYSLKTVKSAMDSLKVVERPHETLLGVGLLN